MEVESAVEGVAAERDGGKAVFRDSWGKNWLEVVVVFCSSEFAQFVEDEFWIAFCTVVLF